MNFLLVGLRGIIQKHLHNCGSVQNATVVIVFSVKNNNYMSGNYLLYILGVDLGRVANAFVCVQ